MKRIVIVGLCLASACLQVESRVGAPFDTNLTAYTAPNVLFRDEFTRLDGIITNEYAHWNPTHGDAAISSAWEMTNGSLFAKSRTGWTGVPDVLVPDARSVWGTGSAVFRLTTRPSHFG